jgi:hypothetical protein
MVSQTASRRSLTLVVRDSDVVAATERLHAEVFERAGSRNVSRLANTGDDVRAARASAMEIQP